jgi:hypothetical protein
LIFKRRKMGMGKGMVDEGKVRKMDLSLWNGKGEPSCDIEV